MRLSLLLLLAFSSALIAQKQISDFTGWLTSETNTRTESQSGEVAETATTSPVATDSTLNVEVCFGEAYIFGEDTLTVSGQYQAVFTDVNGADSTVTLNLEVLPFSGSELNVGICPGESFVFDGDTLTTGGVYNALYTDSNGCDSLVTLNLTNLNHSEPVNLSVTICSGEVYLIGEDALSETGLYSLTLANSVGCDSVVNLDLTVRPDSISTTTLEASFCSGDNYEFNGDILTAGGVYTAILQNSSGCDSIITLELTALETSLTSVDATICAGETYSFEGQDYTETGIYSAVYTNAAGCDSTVTLNLTVQPADYGSSVQATICGNETYAFNGELLNTSGIYAAGLTSIYGCDSTVTLTLNVLPVSETTLEASFCAGDFYEFNGDTLTEGGVYTDVQTNSVGCDSIITLNLVELATSETTIEASICAETTYTFDGQELSESGIYTASYTNEAGCDSTVTLDLTVLPVLETFLTATICGDSIYDFNGEPLTASGLYEAVLAGTNGCDSTVTLSLTVLPISGTGIEASICTGETYEFNGETLTTGGVYTAVLTNANGCDSTITLNLIEFAVSQSTLTATICADETYLFDGEERSESGVYTAVYTNQFGCDSTVTLNLTVIPADLGSSLAVTICEESSYDFYGNILTQSGIYTTVLTNVNGCDSTITLTLTVREPDLTLLEEFLCEGQSYLFNGENLTAPGEYTALLTDSDGCDSLIILNLMAAQPTSSEITGILCEGETYDFNGQTLTEGGVYTSVLTNAAGCDSTVTLTLLFREPDLTLLESSICEGETFLFNGENLTAPGAYSALLTNADGCDSLVVLNLSVLPAAVSMIEASICQGSVYDFNGQILTESGIYVSVVSGANGCDSSIVLTLTTIQPTQTEFFATICEGESILFNGDLISAPGIYTATFTNTIGCDSLVILDLAVAPTTSSLTEAIICSNETYNFNGIEFSQAGTYIFVLTNEVGCDSIATLNLEVQPAYSVALEAKICAGESYEFGGADITESGLYTAAYTTEGGCDSIVVLNLSVTGEFFEVQLEGETLTASAEEGATYKWIDCSTNEPIEGATTNVFTPTVSGIYAVIVSLSDCEITSECTEVIVVSTENPIQEAGWQLLPNPTSGPAQLRMDQVASEVLRLQVFDMAGRLCAEQIIAAGQSNVSVDLSSLSDGMFLARLTSGSVATKMQRVVKVSK
ncbi:MAG: T9SS type A sorting domain-containing protein [Saprospiraceae bacterium]|nr:T9SS type A sorting domain-containing protein [Saprospiraceae bacterium]